MTTEIPAKAIKMVRSFSRPGFKLFFILIHNKTMPDHADEWINDLFEAHEQNKGLLEEAWRGSIKTTLMNTFTAYITGCKPEGSSLIVKANEDSASRSSKDIASMIEHNPLWKIFFPNVVPDKDRGWGYSGYWVKRNDVEYEVWQYSLIGPDPSFVALPFKSDALQGMHPSNILLLDDLLTRDIVESEREMMRVEEVVTATIFPMRSPHNPLTMVVCTPWKHNDVYQKIKATGEFIVRSTPVTLEGTWPGTPRWPEVFDEERIEQERKLDLSGGRDFARMFLLNLEAAKGINLKEEWLHEYPAEQIGDSWGVVFGIDPATTADKLKGRDRDYFALSVGRVIPGGGLILVDGMRMHLSQGEVIDKVTSWAYELYPTFEFGIMETEGIGEQLLQMLLRETGLNLMGANTAAKLVKGDRLQRAKGDRFERQLGPLFRTSRVWISNAANEYLNHFRNEWLSFPDGEHDDTLDATFYMVYAGMQLGALVQTPQMEEAVTPWFEPRGRRGTDWSQLGKARGWQRSKRNSQSALLS